MNYKRQAGEEVGPYSGCLRPFGGATGWYETVWNECFRVAMSAIIMK